MYKVPFFEICSFSTVGVRLIYPYGCLSVSTIVVFGIKSISYWHVNEPCFARVTVLRPIYRPSDGPQMQAADGCYS